MNDIPRELLAKALNGDARVVRYFEDQARVVEDTQALTVSSLAATGSIADATVVTLSPNDSFANERVLQAGRGIDINVGDATVVIAVKRDVVTISGGFQVTMTAQGDSSVAIPLNGILATRDNVETLKGKTLQTPILSGLGNYASDVAAAAGGVPIGGVFHNAGVLRIRLT